LVEPARTDGPTRMSPGRRRMAIAIRWLSLPLAAALVLASTWSLRAEYQRTAHLLPTAATVIEARVVSTSRVTTEWDVYVRYPVRGQSVENSVRVWTPFDLDRGDTITLLVDPDTGHAQDDLRGMAWLLAIVGLLSALFMVLVGFVQTGKLLKLYVAHRT